MFILRLSATADPGRQIDSRRLAEGDLSIGRGPGADWAVADPDRAISRTHLRITVRGGVVTATDTSANGVFRGGGSDERLPRGEPVRLAPGDSLRLGGFTVMLERSEAPAAPAAPDPLLAPATDPLLGRAPDPFAAPDRRAHSPFEPIGGTDPRDAPRGGPDPFASALTRDPLADFGREGGSASSGFEDAWDRRPERRVGDWDAPSPRRESHENLIGADRTWSQPPAAPKPEVGFGFDAPFSRPMLSPVEVTREDLAIPSDWDLPEPAPAARAPTPFAAPPPRPAPVEATRPLPPPEPPRAAPPPEPPPVIFAPPPAPAAPPPTAPAPAPVAFAPPPQPAPAPAAVAAQSGGAFEAFCRGARLDPAAFAGRPSEETMERLGAVYRSMVLGLSDLMNERTTLKNEYRMVRTTVRQADNNPFKWSPPQRVAVDLLRAADDGFMPGPDAVSDSFMDLKKHLICMLAGLRAALGSTLDALSPEQVASAVKEGSFLKNKGAASWAEYERLYAEFRKQADDNADSPLNRAFRAAYEKQLVELDAKSAR